jgi:hypothetical protein
VQALRHFRGRRAASSSAGKQSKAVSKAFTNLLHLEALLGALRVGLSLGLHLGGIASINIIISGRRHLLLGEMRGSQERNEKRERKKRWKTKTASPPKMATDDPVATSNADGSRASL